jgi:putative N-acetylmannosamine-6-phosphate epimerase
MAGIGAHLLSTMQACVAAKIDPDFYMFTVNQVGYLSSAPAEIAQFMRTIHKPWIGFKVLGAGRANPPGGFQHAFERGADFIAVGMFDWQVRDDVAHVQAMLAKGIERERAWA